ncbi:DEAD/DEAH box helicase [Xylophilus sp.]|uniref:DEAD/DEAH box helicase n=1 Tax=Xylophilus sp. TaxID=2653893 RepID=UPI0013BBAFD9|nr:DEAD/DEAH box helicase [Xylophilus sp.]KAF1048193.1 MAG: RNA polymerase-associated protein RapA [Xylophilus sp.]
MTDSHPFLLDPQTLAAHVSAATYERGLAVYRAQQVLDYGIAPASRGEWHLDGTVRGSARQPYEATVVLEIDGDGRVLGFQSACTCPVGRNCKHAVAIALKAAYKSRRAPAGPATLVPAPVEPRQQQHARVAQWLDLFALEAPVAAPPAPPADQLIFLLHLPRPQQQGVQPTLSWGLSRPRRSGGGWTRVKTPYAYYGGPPTRDAGADDLECVRLIAALGAGGYGGSATEGALDGRTGLLALRLAAGSGRLFLADEQRQPGGAPLAWGPERALAWRWNEITRPADPEPAWKLHAHLPGAPGRLLPGSPALYVDPAAGLCGEAVAPGVPAQHLGLLLAAPPIPQSAFETQQAALLARLAGLPLPPTVQPAEPLDGIAPVAHLHIAPVPVDERARLGPLRAALTFDYAGLRRWWPHHQGRVLEAHSGRRVLLHRQLAAELDAEGALQRLGLVADGLGRHHLPPGPLPVASPWLDWAAHGFAPLRDAGFVVTEDADLAGFIQQAGALDVHLTDAEGRPLAEDDSGEGDPWLGLSLGIEIDGVRQNVVPWLPDLLAQLRATPEGAALPAWVWRQREDGGFVRIPSAPLAPWLQALLDLVDDSRALDGETLRLSRLEALRVGAAVGEGVPWAGAAGLRALLARLGGSAQLPAAPVPQGLRAELRPYQRHGLDWLQFLRAHGLAGILADDMGLGKTLQTLAHVLAEKEAGRLDRPALVIAPVSLLGNWQREAARFAPALATCVWHGAGRHGAQARIAASDLVIAPYSLLQRDRALWLAQSWHLVVLDEAQHVKNAGTQAAQVVAGLDARHRLCLSGTPLENHLGELWSLFHFLMPGFLGSAARFKERFRTPIEKHGDPERLHQLRRRITPFLLRRRKAEVAGELPEKLEHVTTVALGGAQADLYETIRLATEKTVRQALADKGLARSQIEFLDALLKLRQVCCDPRLLGERVPAAQKVRQSAKLDLLMELLPEMLAEGRRVLLFSQFTSMLALIEAELTARGLRWTKLTGQTQKRDAAIERFTGGEVPLFLISLKAGGTGLNLPQADTVIHYDPWWNPAVEEQATARAHRIGQRNRVFVYKLVAQGTIEERILALQARKAGLADSLYQGAVARREALFTEDDVAELLRPLE